MLLYTVYTCLKSPLLKGYDIFDRGINVINPKSSSYAKVNPQTWPKFFLKKRKGLLHKYIQFSRSLSHLQHILLLHHFCECYLTLSSSVCCESSRKMIQLLPRWMWGTDGQADLACLSQGQKDVIQSSIREHQCYPLKLLQSLSAATSFWWWFLEPNSAFLKHVLDCVQRKVCQNQETHSGRCPVWFKMCLNIPQY